MLDLDALVNPARLPIVRLFGREVMVKPLTGSAAHRIAMVQSVTDNGESMLGALLEVVKTSCPTLTAEEVAQLSVEQVAAVVQLSRGGVAEVEAMIAERQEKNG
jgi:hypothetical protein